MRSFLTEAMAKSMTAKGGFGLAPAIQAQMLKMEGLA
jgi:Rod binding domain-containing protein